MVKVMLLVLGAYLLGSIPAGYWLVRLFKRVDVRTQGSGNIGMTNVWRVVGPFWGILTLVLDILKGVLAVAAAKTLFAATGPGAEWPWVLAAVAVLLGNVFSVFLGFKGGKGIGVSVGVFFSLLPLESTAGLLAFLLALGATRMISAGSLSGVTVMALFTFVRLGTHGFSLLALLALGLVWWTHRENLKRILAGKENRIGGSKGRALKKKERPGPGSRKGGGKR